MKSNGAELDGATALVTGAARGIGRAVAVALASRGARVVLFDLAPCDQTLASVAAAGPAGRSFRGSVASEPDVLRLFDSVRATERKLDVVVNCAGIQVIRPLLQTTVADFDAVTGVNLKGTFLVGREAARMMTAQPPGGRIINVASELAYLGRAKYSAYCATKGAILSLTRSWARELAPHILVNAVAPGPTNTAMISAECMTPDEIRAEVEGVPLGRIGEPDEIAQAVAFLAGPGATYFTGQCISPNGGAVMF